MTSPATSTPTADGATAAYEIRVTGHLDDHWSAMFGDLILTRCPDGTTTLTGAVADQAQLHGVLARVRDLGVSLLGVRALADTSAQTGEPALAHSLTTDLSLIRLYLMRAGYLLMGVGLALVKWPLLPNAHTLPLYEGVTLCLLTAMSVLAFLGLRYPVKLLPLLLFESTWKLLWLGLVALPKAATGNLDAATADTVFSCSLVVLILVVTPWRYVWSTYVRASGDRWR